MRRREDPSVPGGSSRFEALDGCRGVFAVMVAVMHLQLANHAFDMPFVGASYLAVDFFFVLSGFVIAHATKLRDGRDLVRFAWRRFARVWPLHALMLGLFVGFEALKLALQLRGATADTPAFAPGTEYDPLAIPAHLLLVHGLDLFPHATWNVPSWSISTEFYTYLVFALCALSVRRLWVVALVLATVGATVLYFHAATMDVTHDLGFPRCLFGFFTGVLVQRAYAARPVASARGGTLRELACVALAGLLLQYTGESRWSLAAPLVFAPAIWVFAHERGALSRGLRTPALQALGRWSYALYMVHAFVFAVSYRVAHLVERKLERPLFGERGMSPEGMPWKVLAFGDAWTMDLVTVAMLALVIALSALAHRYFELPAQRWLLRHQPRASVRSTIATGTLGGSQDAA